MTQGKPADFANLYRAAFAERDPDKKLTLLREVQQLLHSWQQTEEGLIVSDSENKPQSRHFVRAASIV